MSIVWKPFEFKIALNMAGAVSAGAYTAGVLDFLIEALEEWQKAKVAFEMHLANFPSHETFDNPVPLHDISIEVFSGASAGGMCAAIAACMVQGSFTHITDPNTTGTNNTFYESWVNKIDISGLLTANDLKNDATLTSLLDSTIIDTIAESALTPGIPCPRPYISNSLTLFLTLTNVRGVPYQLYTDPSPTINEFVTYYADHLAFETTHPGAPTSNPFAKPLPLGQPKNDAWPLLRIAAKATGAFPLFLAPRQLTRDLTDYQVPGWIPLSSAPPDPRIVPNLPTAPPPTISTLNIDGGVTDNDPFDLAHDFLASKNPKAVDGMNPRSPLEANCAVISVAPFPATTGYNANYDFSAEQQIVPMLGTLATVLLSQSRFLGESLAVLTNGAAFSRFVIAPADPTQNNKDALQCGKLGAFGGFMERSFRAHDFLLGRRNCQMFLKTHFRLPVDSQVIAAGQTKTGSYAETVQSRFASDPPPGVSVPPGGKVWMPLIPLLGSASAEVRAPSRGVITEDKIKTIANMVLSRVNAIKGPLLTGAPAAWLLKTLIGIACNPPIRLFTRRKVVNALKTGLSPDVTGPRTSIRQT
ncbi:MAG: patatin-like phospholipase family protein [Candidatus Acidiferrum sp.]|jgi:predicted acylesterase/phospholipase RssA